MDEHLRECQTLLRALVMEAGVVLDAGVSAGVAAALASVAGLVDELAGVVAGRPAALDGPSGAPDADADPLQDESKVCLDGFGRCRSRLWL